ncbi:hypothetical protein AB0H83_19480 [Dactylosporangium sp. NPDC050688]|uniref:hypothetical protein n=1 Tax=Dactylosporangium sp. NPDC050688 TaxID=3157217 RepID=UPI00340BB62F
MRPEDVLAGTDWSAGPHAYEDEPGVPSTPEVLAALLDGDADRRGEALSDLYLLVHHQGGVHAATAQAVRFAVAALDDPRSLAPVVPRRRYAAGMVPVRAALLDWLASVMGAAAEPEDRRPGYPADVAACRALRPLVYDAAARFRADPDPAVAAGALRAVLACLLDAPELAGHRPAAAGWLRGAFATLDRQARAVAVLALQEWGHDTSQFAGSDPDSLVRAAAAISSGHPGAAEALRAALVAPEVRQRCLQLFPHYGPIMLFHVLPAAVDRIPIDDLAPTLDVFLGTAPPEVYVADWGTRLHARWLSAGQRDRRALLDVIGRRCFGPDAPRHWSDFDARTALADLVTS